MEELKLPGLTTPLPWRRSDRARHFALRVRPQDGQVELVVPGRAALPRAVAFAMEHRDWIAERQAAKPHRTPFFSGMEIPLLGLPHTIRHQPHVRGGAWAKDGIIHVTGDPAHMNRRVTDFLKNRARAEIAPRAHAKAARLGRKVKRISIRDTATRWGSCSHDGCLSFSWRLILTPAEVLDYVVAHEVAHLAEMNHSQRFWTLVDLVAPGALQQRGWLRKNGSQLLAYG